jgi:uncharacterized Ntn-hydrolase superfamily protein
MNPALRTAVCMAVAGPVAAVVHVGQVILDRLDVMVMPDVSVPDPTADDDEQAVSSAGAAVALTGLDAERWVNDLTDLHAASGACIPEDPCGNYDCRGCWLRATGATG